MTCLAAFFAIAQAAAPEPPAKKSAPPLPDPLTPAWQHTLTLPEGSKETPFLTAGQSMIFLNSAEMGLTAYAAEDGSPLWAATDRSKISVAAFGSRVAVASEAGLTVLSQADGTQAWGTGLPAMPSSLFGFGDRIGATVGQDLLTWSNPGDMRRTELGALPVTRVVFSDGTLYVGLAEPSLVAIDAGTGAIRWRVPLPAKPESLTVYGPLLYLGAEDSIYFYSTSGEAKWDKRRRLVGTRGEPVVDDRFVYFALLDNTVRAFDRKGGAERWSTNIGARAKAGPMLIGPSVAVAVETGNVVEVLAADGKRRMPATAPKLTFERVQHVVATGDGTRIVTIATSSDDQRLLTAWARPKPKGLP